jgi:hypothetical protein
MSRIQGPWLLPQGLFQGLAVLAFQHLLLGAPGTAPFLAADLLDLPAESALFFEDPLFQSLDQEPPGVKPIHRLAPALLATNLNSGRFMGQENRNRSLIDLLSSGAGSANKLLAQIRLANAERLHSPH